MSDTAEPSERLWSSYEILKVEIVPIKVIYISRKK